MDVLDTTAFSAAMRNEPAMVDFLRARQPGDVAVVPPVVAEIEYGIRRLEPGSKKRSLLSDRQAKLLSAIRVLDWTPRASVEFGRIKAALEQAGQLIDDFDIAVAAIAWAHNAGVITANAAHFAHVEGLRCRHWGGPDPAPNRG
jgi:tRNA(fMet)-specific endonuclease VapC